MRNKPAPTVEHELIFAVKQLNLDSLEKTILERATPGNKNYLKWLTFEEVGEYIKNPSGFKAVTTWLSENGVKPSWISKRKEFLKATAPVAAWEKMLNTTFYYWADENPISRPEKESLVLRSLEFSLPESVHEHLDTIFNTVQPLPIIYNHMRLLEGAPYRRDFKFSEQPSDSNVAASPTFAPTPAPLVATVEYLDEYYSIPTNIGNSDANYGQSVFETNSMSFSQEDLTQFQTTFGLTQQAALDIGGFDIPSNQCSFNTCGEGSLDIQYIMGISQTTVSTYYYVGTNDPFVTWVTDLANDANPPKSNSMSWGGIENSLPTSVLNAFNTEAMKLGGIGVTVTISSGDNGVANGGCGCTTNSGSSQSHWTGAGSWTGQGYFPSFPASNPWVTGIGATMGLGGYPPAPGSPSITCQSQLGGVITSGGGFSTYYAQPTWQQGAVNKYFTGLSGSDIPAPGYNKNGRGIPDMAMMGVWYQVVINGTMNSVFGTSCSSPLTAGIVSLVNARRLAAGLGSIGYMNPTLYTNALQFNDVVSGSNNCCASSIAVNATCCTAGFTATAGWDPLTGLGSVQFPAFAAMFGVPV